MRGNADDTSELWRTPREAGRLPGPRIPLARRDFLAWLVSVAALGMATGAALLGSRGEKNAGPVEPVEPAIAPPNPVKVRPNEVGRAAAPQSTPRDQWEKGVMPHLYQTDPEWAGVEYSGGTIARQGCGPTALSMVYVYLTGNTDLDPAGMAEFSTQNGFSTDGEGSYWALMSEGAELLGLSSRAVEVSAEALRAELESGRPVIAVVAPGIFTEYGHFLVLERMDSTSTKFVIHDPNSVPYSMRTWDPHVIAGEAEAAWSYSA